MKRLFLIGLAVLFLFGTPKNVFALQDDNFAISVDALYEVNDEGVTSVTQNISIKNKKDFIYTPSYGISIGLSDISNIQVYNSEGSIPFTLVDDKKEEKTVKINFEKRYTGINTQNNFTLKFDTNDIAFKRGNVWEISVPGLADIQDFAKYNISLSVPYSFEKASVLKPSKEFGRGQTLTFSKEEVGKAGVFAIFGKEQFYSFNLHYNISNPNFYPVKTEIALPPSTSYQEILLEKLEPRPDNVTFDDDGNWIAEYRLLPQQKIVARAQGMVRVVAIPTKENLSEQKAQEYTMPAKFWEVDSPEIQKLAHELKTPEKIYEYVVKTLEYDYAKIASKDNRLGALGVLKNPKNDVCLEFSDLFVTLARAAGIPSRAIEGYAYTDNDKLRPLSLVEDVLHAWPSYYDFKKHMWIMVDPTWGNTTKGIDYFNTLDFEHIAFVVKGRDSTYPIPAGGYKFEKITKDVYIAFAQSNAFVPKENVIISDTFPSQSFFNFPFEGQVVVKNLGNITSEKKKITIQTSYNNKLMEYEVDRIPPFGYQTINLKLDKLPFLTKGSYAITISFEGKKYTKQIHASFLPDRQIILIGGVIFIGAIITFIITLRTGSVLIQRRKRNNSLRRKS